MSTGTKARSPHSKSCIEMNAAFGTVFQRMANAHRCSLCPKLVRKTRAFVNDAANCRSIKDVRLEAFAVQCTPLWAPEGFGYRNRVQASGLLSNGKGGFLFCLQLGKRRPTPSSFFFSSRQALVPKLNQSLFDVNIAKGAGRFALSIGSFACDRVGRLFWLGWRPTAYICRRNAGTRFRKNKHRSWS